MASPDNRIPIIELPQDLQRQLGSLMADSGRGNISLPLDSVEIGARVIDRVAQVTVKQVFRNNSRQALEAVYIFPLAPATAIFSFNMKVGDRSVKGIVQERAEARAQYQQAVSDGKRAALMEQERDDVFTVQVGNLPPGEAITIEISYSERLPFFEDGCSELRLPLVVAPRYIPGSALDRESVGDGSSVDTDLVPDASRISPPRLAHGVDPQTAFKLKVEILAQEGAQISDLNCSQHATRTDLSEGGLLVSLARVDEKLNRDFVLRWRSTSQAVRTSLLIHTAEDGQTYGMLSIMPPRRVGYLGAARDIVFVLDRSGSMQGVKMTSAVRACSILLATLGANDRFAIAAFDTTVEWMPAADPAHFVSADVAGQERGEKYLRTITARGGTEMDRALRSSFDALNNRSAGEGRLPSLVVLTDGEVGNESQILQRIQKEIGDARLFVVGIDTAVNSGLLKRLANLGGGTAAFVEPGIQLEEALASIAREIGAPLASDLQVENLDLKLDRASLSPSRIPDLFAGRASVCFFKASGKGRLRIKGKLADGKTFEEKVKAQDVEMSAIAQLWAKAHIVELEDQFRINNSTRGTAKQKIIDLAVKHSLLTRFTAFVVVDESEIVNKTGEARRVVQPVEMPADWQTDQLINTGSWGANSPVGGAAPPADLLCQLSRQSAGSPAPKSLKKLKSGNTSAAQVARSYGAAPVPEAVSYESCQSEIADSGSIGGASLWSASPSVKKQEGSQPASPASNSPAAEGAKECAPKPLHSYSSQAIPPASSPAAPPAPPSPAQQPPIPSPPSGLASFFQKMTGTNNKDKAQKGENSAKKTELAATRVILEEFFNEFENAFQKIENDILPDGAKLEALRLQLVQTLAPTKLGMELPCLQRFLRSTGIELVSSLKDSSITLADLKDFWQQKHEIFDELKREIKNLLSGTEAAFWDSSI